MGHFVKKRRVYDQDGVVVPTGLDTNVDLLAGNIVSGNTTVTSIAANSIVFTDATSTLVADGNLTFDGTTLSINGALVVDDLTFDANTISVAGNGTLVLDTTSSLQLPSGTSAERPLLPTYGEIRFNTDSDTAEIWQNVDGVDTWFPVTPNVEIASQTEIGNGFTTNWVLNQNATSVGLFVTLNGLVQEPGTAYTVSDIAGVSYINFAEPPQATDTVVIRFIQTVASVTRLYNDTTGTEINVNNLNQQLDITGNLIPTANVTYDLGALSTRWNDLYLAGNSIYLGNLVLKDNGDNTLGVFQSDGVTEAVVTSTAEDAVTAQRWETPRLFEFVGDVSGSAYVDGSLNVTIPLQVSDNSHTHSLYADKLSDQVLRPVDALQVANGNEVTIVKGDDTTESIIVQGTLTSLTFASNLLTYVDEAGTSTVIDLTQYVDDTNLARITNGTLDGVTGIATFQRDDASTFTIDFSPLFDDTNLARIESGNLDSNTGIVTFYRNDSSSFDVDLSAFLVQGAGSGLDADTVDGQHYDDIYDNIMADATAIAIALG